MVHARGPSWLASRSSHLQGARLNAVAIGQEDGVGTGISFHADDILGHHVRAILQEHVQCGLYDGKEVNRQ